MWTIIIYAGGASFLFGIGYLIKLGISGKNHKKNVTAQAVKVLKG